MSEKRYKDGVPCDHPGCTSHRSHPCEGCGRIGAREVSEKSKPRELAEECWTQIAANGGFLDQEYVTRCIEETIKEACRKLIGDLFAVEVKNKK